MKKTLLVISVMLLFGMSLLAQNKEAQLKHIREMYAQAKEQIAQNGKDGRAPLDMKILINDGSYISDDLVINDVTELHFYFNKYRINSDLDYPDASSCYFITEQWGANGHTRYREILFDSNEGVLLFSYMKAETHAGFTVETRYYYDGEGRLIDDKHKVGGQEVNANAHSWSSAEGDKAIAEAYLKIFEDLMNHQTDISVEERPGAKVTPKAQRMKYIRSTYAEAKEKIAKNDKSELPLDVQVVIRDQSWGPPEITELKFYFDAVTDQVEPDAVSVDNYCYFISEHRHHNNMGFDNYGEFLFAPMSHDLIFSYSCSKEEGEKREWRYYFDERGKCIEVKSEAEEVDYGFSDKITVKHYLKIFKALFNRPM
jgi:hypothetical protein